MTVRTEAGVVQLPRYTGRAFCRGPDVELGEQIPDGRTFKTVEEYEKLLPADKDQLARNLAEKPLVYSTGAGIQSADRELVE